MTPLILEDFNVRTAWPPPETEPVVSPPDPSLGQDEAWTLGYIQGARQREPAPDHLAALLAGTRSVDQKIAEMIDRANVSIASALADVLVTAIPEIDSGLAASRVMTVVERIRTRQGANIEYSFVDKAGIRQGFTDLPALLQALDEAGSPANLVVAWQGGQATFDRRRFIEDLSGAIAPLRIAGGSSNE